jgi:hypothetical protein
VSIGISDERNVFVYDSVTGTPLPVELFSSTAEAELYLAFVNTQIGGRDPRILSAREHDELRKVWERVWASMEANPEHEHNPGCSYQSHCTCGWESGWGDSDNAFYRAWDHTHDDRPKDGREHRTHSVHR